MPTPIARRLPALLVASFLAAAAVAADATSTEPSSRKTLELPDALTEVLHSPADWATMKKEIATNEDPAQRDFAIVDQGPTRFAVLNIEFRDAAACRAFNVAGTHVISRYDRFADVFVPAEEEVINAVIAAPGIVWMEQASNPLLPPPPPLRPSEGESRQEPAPIVRGGAKGLSGKGVVIAVLDSGVDFRHPDFITYDTQGRPTSRILYFWDTDSDLHVFGDVGKPAPVTFPNGAPIGTVYSRDDLTAELRRSRPRIPVGDMGGHGTACAGVAAGNGNASNGRNMGVAPQADLIAIRLGGNGPHDPTIGKAWLFGAICDWLEKVVGNRPLVVSCSYGGHYSGHDGHSIVERQIDARFPLARAGRAICIAAGNEGSDPIHAEPAPTDSAGNAAIEWETPAGAIINLYFQSSNLNDIQRGYEGTAQLQVLGQPFVHGLTGQMVVALESSPGRGKLYFTSRSGSPLQIDAYCLTPDGGFVDDSVSARELVGSPGCAANAITVGSFNWNDELEHHGHTFTYPDVVHPSELMTIGGVSAYSSPGPLRIGDVVKPDITAPGQWHAAPVPINVATHLTRDSTGFYAPFNGTSAATPYTAGVVALIMEKKPGITLGQIKDLLKTSGTSDHYTGEIPNPQWGYGKLDRAAVEKMLSKVN